MSRGRRPVWLFVSYGGGHVNALLPVARRVQDLSLAHPVYLALTTAAAPVRAAGLQVLGFRDLVRAGDEDALRKGQDLARGLQVQAAQAQESAAYLGLSYADMEARLGIREAACEYARYGRQAFLPIGVLRRVLEQVRPELVVATNSPRAERAAIETARAMGIPSACLVDLLGIWERELLARPDYADAVCVLNEGVRRSLVDAGRPADHVHVTGNPAFDAINDAQVVERGAALRRATGWEGMHVCLYASSPEPHRIPGVAGEGDVRFPRAIERVLLATVEANPALALWVRRHPSEPAADEVSGLGHPRIRVSGPDTPLHVAIHASDEAVVTVSTVGVEAHLAGKRVTQVRGSILDHLSPYFAMGVADRELPLAALPLAWTGEPPCAPRTLLRDAPQGATARVVDVLQHLRAARRG